MNVDFALNPARRGSTGTMRPHARMRDGLATGWAQLDDVLADGGWPAGALSEILHDADSVDALSLLLPALAALTQSARRVVLIEPPTLRAMQVLHEHGIRREFLHVVKSEAHAGGWSAEQYLRSGCAAAVLLWPHANDAQRLRSLQQCAQAGASHAFVMRDTSLARHISPADLRVMLERDTRGLTVNVLPSRGSQHSCNVLLPTTGSR